MTNWAINIYEVVRHVIPHFLQKLGNSQYWVTPDDLIWIIPSGLGWGTGTPSRHMGWIKALLAPLQSLHDRFTAKANDTLYIMNITGQVIYLEHYLNDLFDPTLRRIYIGDGTIVLPPYLFNKVDSAPVWHVYNKTDGEPTQYLYNRADYAVQSEFIVFVPSAIILTPILISQIKTAVNRFKQAGVKYSIESF